MFKQGRIRGYLKLGGQLVMWRAVAAAPLPGGTSILPKTGWATAHPANPPLTLLLKVILNNQYVDCRPYIYATTKRVVKKLSDQTC